MSDRMSVSMQNFKPCYLSKMRSKGKKQKIIKLSAGIRPADNFQIYRGIYIMPNITFEENK